MRTKHSYIIVKNTGLFIWKFNKQLRYLTLSNAVGIFEAVRALDTKNLTDLK